MKSAHLLIGVIASALSWNAHAQSVPPKTLMTPFTAYTAQTAPDARSRAVLAKTLHRLDEGTPIGTNPLDTIHKNFPQLIEQNFAIRDRLATGMLLDSLSEAELSDLAQVYVNTTTSLRKEQQLLHVIASRGLRANQLARLSQHFGYAPVAAAVTASADSTTKAAFASLPRSSYAGPTPGDMRFGLNGRFAPPAAARARMTQTLFTGSVSLTPAVYLSSHAQRPRLLKVNDWANFTNVTPEEIYLTFRTAPGALAMGVQGSLFATSLVLYAGIDASWRFGQWVGTSAILPLIQTYAPGFYENIGRTMDGIVQVLTNTAGAPPSVQGPAESSAAQDMQVPYSGQDYSESTGGDYGITTAWAEWSSGGGGGGGLTGVGCAGSGGIHSPRTPNSNVKPDGPTTNLCL